MIGAAAEGSPVGIGVVERQRRELAEVAVSPSWDVLGHEQVAGNGSRTGG